jgi:hypothetical protein
MTYWSISMTGAEGDSTPSPFSVQAVGDDAEMGMKLPGEDGKSGNGSVC